MKVILTPCGSYGDVHPFVGLGRALRSRGHEVTIIVNEQFESLARAAGLEVLRLGTRDIYERATGNPDIWHPWKGLKVIAELTFGYQGELYKLIERAYVPGETVVATGGLAFAARIARDKLALPLVTVHLQPACFVSAHETPAPPIGSVPGWLPTFVKRGYCSLVNIFGDRIYGKAVNRFRAELGLAPVKRILGEWWHSPDRVLGLFPDWFAEPQPDWPPRTELTSFPLYDESDVTPLPDGLEDFLEAGEPPIVFTPGSANRQGQRFFEEAVGACQSLGVRAVLLTRYPEQLPPDMPDFVRHFDFVPLSQLLERSRAMVHHGGIGTVAQALASGVPQLIMPMAYDQPDNAWRLKRMGVGASLRPRKFRRKRVARVLEGLLSSSSVAEQCREYADRLRQNPGLERSCEIIEEVFAGR